MAVRIQIRRGTAAEWAAANTVLADGEQGYETDTGRLKVGDGATAWADLDYYDEHVAAHVIASSPAVVAAAAAAVDDELASNPNLAAVNTPGAEGEVLTVVSGTADWAPGLSQQDIEDAAAAAAAAAVGADIQVAQLMTDMASINVRVDNVEPAALTAKDRVLDLSDYVDISGVSNSTAGMQQAIIDATTGDMARAIWLRSNSTVKVDLGELYVPDAGRFRLNIVGDGQFSSRILASGSGSGALIQTDPNTTPTTTTRRSYWRMENLYIEGPGQGVSGSVGLHLNNALDGHARNIVVQNFETNIWLDALNLENGAACYYNNFFQVTSRNSEMAWRIDRQANSNKFFGGRAFYSTLGVWIIGESTTDNSFIGMDIEGNGNASSPAIVVDGYQNEFRSCRHENSSAQWEVWFNRAGSLGAGAGAGNTIDGYWSTSNERARIKDDSPNSSNTIMGHSLKRIGGPVNATTHQNALEIVRSVNPGGKPMIVVEDTSTVSSGQGYVYKSVRSDVKYFVGQATSGAERFVAGANSSGQGYFEWEASNGTKAAIRMTHVDPNGVFIGNIGSLIMRTGAGGGLYVKTSGDGTNTGWQKVAVV